MTTTGLHNTISQQLNQRPTNLLIREAKVARLGKAHEEYRKVFCIIMDALQDRLPSAEFEALYEEITND